jgi:hypothetical protein
MEHANLEQTVVEQDAKVTLEPPALELVARGLWPQYVDLITSEVL